MSIVLFNGTATMGLTANTWETVTFSTLSISPVCTAMERFAVREFNSSI
jgi:hypothetical protein